MKLKDVEFGHVFNASGARGFTGEGYWFHPLARPFGLDYRGSTLVCKTTTLHPRVGNMMIDTYGRPLEIVPGCIVVKPFAGVVLNAVGLSGPGAFALFDRWRGRRERYVISIMSVAQTAGERLGEARNLIGLVEPLMGLNDRAALQINFSCPNVGLDVAHLIDEIVAVLEHTARRGIRTMVKLSAVTPPQGVVEMLEAHPGCDALVMSNTIPWGRLPDRIDWAGLFGSTTSPLVRYGGGGLSGKPLLPIVTQWIRQARAAGFTKPIVGGGGILSVADANAMLDAGASTIELGSVSILRPWRVQDIIRHINVRLGGAST